MLQLQPWLNHINIRPHWMSSLVISNNHNERLMALDNPNFRVVILDDEPFKYFELIDGEYKLPKHESVYSVLLPPPESTEFFIEGDYEKSEQCYYEYLYYNPNVNHFLNTIFTLLFQNVSVLLFVPQDADRTWASINTLMTYMITRFGIITCNISQIIPCLDLTSISPDIYAALIDIMYTNGTIPVSEFCLQYPLEMVNVVSDLAVRKICIEELSSVIDINNADSLTISTYVYNFIMGMKQNIINNITNNTGEKKINLVVNMEGVY